MTTGIRNLSVDSTREVFDQIPHFTDGPDGYVVVSEDELGAVKAYIQGEFPADEAEVMLETFTAREDLVDAATRGADDDLDLDLSELFGFRREASAVKRVTPARLAANADGDGVILVVGSLQVPAVQEGKTLTIGGLTAGIAEDYKLTTKATQKGDIHFHEMRLEDSETKSLFDVALFVKPDVDPAAVKLALKAGSPLEEILSGPGSGGGGAVNLKDFLSEEMIPWRATITEVRQYDSASEFSVDGKSYSAVLEGGQGVWLRGEAEKRVHENYDKIRADLAKGKGWVLKATSFQRDGDKVRIKTGLESASAGSYFQGLVAAANEAPALEAAAEVEAPVVEATSKVSPIKAKSNPFAKTKAAA